jgi:putative FmdB family regulatory protein
VPIYEYKCRVCGQICEAIQKLYDRPLRACRLCGAKKPFKLTSAPALVLHEGLRAAPSPRAAEHRHCSTLDLTVPADFRHPSLSFPLVRGEDLPISIRRPTGKEPK